MVFADKEGIRAETVTSDFAKRHLRWSALTFMKKEKENLQS